jgi:hypothetical protein
MAKGQMRVPKEKSKPKQLSPYKLAQMQGTHAASPFTTPPAVKKP